MVLNLGTGEALHDLNIIIADPFKLSRLKGSLNAWETLSLKGLKDSKQHSPVRHGGLIAHPQLKLANPKW